MNKELDEQQLIELAKKAKPVPVEPETQPKRGVKKAVYSSITDFMNATGLKPGRNDVEVSFIYEAYEFWSSSPMGKKQFGKELTKFLKSPKPGFYKLNMKPITLMEIIKELKQHETQQQEEEE